MWLPAVDGTQSGEAFCTASGTSDGALSVFGSQTTRSDVPCLNFFFRLSTQPLPSSPSPEPMSSFLDEIVNLNQLQNKSAVPIASLPPLTRPMHQDFAANSDNDSSPGSGDEDREQDTQPPLSTQDSPDAVAAFTVNTSRNLRLTADGERSLLEFSRVAFSVPPSYACVV